MLVHVLSYTVCALLVSVFAGSATIDICSEGSSALISMLPLSHVLISVSKFFGYSCVMSLVPLCCILLFGEINSTQTFIISQLNS